MPDQKATTQPFDEEKSKKLLRGYVFYRRDTTLQRFVPHRIDPEVASEVIKNEVKPDAEVDHIFHACNAVRFYLLHDCLDHLGGFLSRSTREIDGVFRSVESIQLLGDLGDDRQQKTADEHWGKLAGHRKLAEIADLLIRTFFHLGPDASPKPLNDRLEAMYRDKLKQLPDPKHPDTATNKLDHLVHYDLVRAVAAKRQKDRILTAAQDDLRAYSLARVYLGLTDYSILGQDWAGYALLDEAEKSAAANVVAGVRRALTDFEKADPGSDDPDLVTEFRVDARARAYSAIAYFGGELSDKESGLLTDKDGPPENLYSPQPESQG